MINSLHRYHDYPHFFNNLFSEAPDGVLEQTVFVVKNSEKISITKFFLDIRLVIAIKNAFFQSPFFRHLAHSCEKSRSFHANRLILERKTSLNDRNFRANGGSFHAKFDPLFEHFKSHFSI
ncbi:hypothetical protein HanRHA438_Chr06g0260831 [Helianthus annuus]|nr:hypothetical protein HanRHA438_Chr06g0260831 [Helianthus annuus]